MCLALCLGSRARATPPDLVRAEALFSELKYSECLAATEAAWRAGGNDRASVLRILELQGLAAAAVGRKPLAQTALRCASSIATSPRRICWSPTTGS